MRIPQTFRSLSHWQILAVIALLVFAGIAQAKDFWESKPFDQWSEKDCQKLLTNSPWAKQLNLVGIDFGGTSASMDSQAPFINYTIQLRSVALIRQAVVRQMQLLNKYDEMAADKKQAFDKSTQNFLSGPSSEFVVVHVSFVTNNRDYMRDLLRHWESQTVDLLKNSVYLSGSKGEKVSLTQYVPVQGAAQEFQFIFPRSVDGKEILQPGDKELQLEFTYPVIGGIGDGRGYIEFKTNKMKVNNEVAY